MALNLSAEEQQRFWSHVEIGDDDDCWEWLAYQNQDGYGQVAVGRKTMQAHRVAFELGTGKAPGNLHVCHSCDNPLCCNPAHLWLGTNADNMRDMVEKGRAQSKLTEDDVHKTGDYTQQELADAFGVARQNISHIVNKKSWGWF